MRINKNIKPEIGIQLSFISEIQLKKEHFWAKYPPLLVIEASIFNACYDRKLYTYGMT